MNKFVFIFLLQCSFFIGCSSQSFEGMIVYENSYKSKVDSISDENLMSMYGLNLSQFINKDGDYVGLYRGNYLGLQLFLKKENRLYTQLNTTEIVYYQDSRISNDSILSYNIILNADTVYGYLCNMLELETVLGEKRQYYYSPNKFWIDASLYDDHKLGNYAFIISKIHSLPLKIVVNNSVFTITSTVNNIVEGEIKKKSIFTVPEGVIIEPLE